MPTRQEKQWQHVRENAEMRHVRKQIRRRRKTKRARPKEWQNARSYELPEDLDDLDELYRVDQPRRERVMPRGEQERRRAVLEEALASLQEPSEDNDVSVSQSGPGLRGRVIEVSSSLCRVRLDGHSLLCDVRGSLSAQDSGFTNVVAVGDEVIVSKEQAGRGIVEAVLPRQTALPRPDVYYSHLQQVVVANADQLLIVASWREPHFWPELVDRYLITAERSQLTPIICVNKIDLAPDRTACNEALQPYVDLGYRVIFASALRGQGVPELRRALRDRTTVLAGLSGVGKSSLISAVQPRLQLRVSDVSERLHGGRHTTTQVNLLELAPSSFVIDTPGIREFGLSGLHRAELIRFYPDISAVEAGCRFGNCSHTHEPDCAVSAAARQGCLSARRYENYKAIYQSLPN